MNDEGNRPNYVANCLRYKCIGNTLDIIGFYLEFPQRTVFKKLDDVKIVNHITKLGTVGVLELTGEIKEWSSEYKSKMEALREGTEYNSFPKYYTKVLQIKSGNYERKFFVDREVDFGDPRNFDSG